MRGRYSSGQLSGVPSRAQSPARARGGGSGPAIAADASMSAGRGNGGTVYPVHERLVEPQALLKAAVITGEEGHTKHILAEPDSRGWV